MLQQIKKWFILSFTNKCPECSEPLDNDVHGYNYKWRHCYNCGYCTNRHCGVKS